MDEARRAPAIVRRMAKAANTFLASLRPEQRAVATARFDVADHKAWTYLPGPRPGLSLAEMTSEQQAYALDLLDIGCSPMGVQTARAIMQLDGILRAIEQQGDKPGWERRHPEHYWIRVLGDPGGAEPWAWRINGHHLAVHLTIVEDSIAVTPQFFGANPARVPSGPHQGLRTLPGEEDLARNLLAALNTAQRKAAMTQAVAPDDILTRRDPVADPTVIPRGLAYGDMHDMQRDLLRRLIRLYFDHTTPDAANAAWKRAEDAGLETVAFTWAGSDRPGDPHYYAVLGPTFLLEYDNVQDGANHIHTVWRELGGDWGEDLLAAHYAAHRH
jgi:hypothetical protein